MHPSYLNNEDIVNNIESNRLSWEEHVRINEKRTKWNARRQNEEDEKTRMNAKKLECYDLGAGRVWLKIEECKVFWFARPRFI